VTPLTHLFGVDTRLLYTALVALVALQRIWELSVSNRNVRALQDQGAIEAGAGHYPVMVALHTGFLVSCVAEVWLAGRPFLPFLALTMLGLLAAASGLRLWAIRSLGGRWTTRVLCLPGAKPVTRGPYQWLRHPNYVAVIVEMAALPLVHTAWATALVFSLANGALLRHRIRCEEEALQATGRYRDHLGDRPRFVPKGAGGGSR
jgi:methyltransferase